MLKLHDYVLSPEGYTVRLMLALLDVPYERIAVDAYPGNADRPGAGATATPASAMPA